MKITKLFAVSLVAVMVATTANAELASKGYVDDQVTTINAKDEAQDIALGTETRDREAADTALDTRVKNNEGAISGLSTSVTSLQTDKADKSTTFTKDETNQAIATATAGLATDSKLGTLSTLKTSAKTDLVAAVNEVHDDAANAQGTATNAANAVSDLAKGAVASNTAAIKVINDSKVMASGVTSEIVEQVGTNTNAIATTLTQVTENKNAIATKVDQTAYNNKVSELESSITAANTATGTALTTAKAYTDTEVGKVKSDLAENYVDNTVFNTSINALDNKKQNKLTGGANITIDDTDGTISVTGTVARAQADADGKDIKATYETKENVSKLATEVAKKLATPDKECSNTGAKCALVIAGVAGGGTELQWEVIQRGTSEPK